MNLSVNQRAKHDAVEKLKSDIKVSNIAVAFHYHGLTVSNISDLRKEIRNENATMSVVKNTLAKIAFEGSEFACLEPVLTGPVAIAYSSDPSFVKAIAKFAKSNENLKIVGGAINGKLLDVNGVKVLSEMPSHEELKAKIVGIINQPATLIASIINNVPTAIARVIQARSEQNNNN
jgi:large subunit ribosomal protein L10